MEYEYFAIKSDHGDLMAKVDDFYNQMRNVGHVDRIRRSYAQYHGNSIDGRTDRLVSAGEQGELSKLSVNKYRSFLRHQLSLVTAERPATHVTPINTDHKSMASAIVGEQILDYYMRAKNLEKVIFDATEKANWSSEGYIALEWDVEAGEPYAVDPDDDSKAAMTGDVVYRTYTADEVCRDIYDVNPSWYITVDYVNKWDYVARFPEHKDDILTSGRQPGGKQNYSNYNYATGATNEDRIALFRFYHKKTPALPEGRMVLFTSNVKLYDSPLPYPEIPLYRVAPAEVDSTNLGYTQGFDLLGAQETIDELYTAVISNNLAFSRQCIVMPRGSDVHHRDIADGLTLIEADPEDAKNIRALQLTNSSPETYNLIDRLDGEMQAMTGINEVVRGAPGPNVRAGNAMALLSAQAIKFNSTLQQAYVKLIEDVGTATLKFLQEYAKAPRFIEIVSKSERAYLQEFDSESLSGVSRVHVEITSALSKTQAGRVDIANALLQQGMIKRPEQYISVLNSGKLDPVIEAEQSEMMNIRAENEMLATGDLPPVILTDNHALHIREHRTVLDSPDARMDQAAVEATLMHIQEHINTWAQTDPNVLAATGQQPMMAPPQPTGPLGSEGVPVEGMSPESLGAMDVPEEPSMPGLPPETDPQDAEAYAESLPEGANVPL